MSNFFSFNTYFPYLKYLYRLATQDMAFSQARLLGQSIFSHVIGYYYVIPIVKIQYFIKHFFIEWYIFSIHLFFSVTLYRQILSENIWQCVRNFSKKIWKFDQKNQ